MSWFFCVCRLELFAASPWLPALAPPTLFPPRLSVAAPLLPSASAWVWGVAWPFVLALRLGRSLRRVGASARIAAFSSGFTGLFFVFVRLSAELLLAPCVCVCLRCLKYHVDWDYLLVLHPVADFFVWFYELLSS